MISLSLYAIQSMQCVCEMLQHCMKIEQVYFDRVRGLGRLTGKNKRFEITSDEVRIMAKCYLTTDYHFIGA